MLKEKRITIILLMLILMIPMRSFGQFNNYSQTGPPGRDLMQNQNNQQNEEEEESVAKRKPAYTFKRYFRALAHKDSVDIARLFYGNVIVPGTAQFYNRDYWKIPVIYCSIGGCIGGAAYYNKKYKSSGKESYKDLKNLCIAGAAFFYWGQLMDGVASFKSEKKPLPARASLFSALLPGLGQAYNGDYWKIPVFYTGLTISGYCWAFNQKQYRRYRNLYIQAATPDGGYKGHSSAEDLKWYRDSFRRLRDYSILATGLIYVLNIIDANVFAHFNNFDVSDDISFNIEPAVIDPYFVPGINLNNTDMLSYSCSPQVFGLKMNLNF